LSARVLPVDQYYDFKPISTQVDDLLTWNSTQENLSPFKKNQLAVMKADTRK